MKNIVLLIILLLMAVGMNAQEPLKRVYGVVMRESGEPVANVMVSVEGKNKFAMTNNEGIFTFSKLTTADSLLVIVPGMGMTRVGCHGGKIEVVVGMEEESAFNKLLEEDRKKALNNHRIEGYVNIEETQEPLPYATVLLSDLEDKEIGHTATDSTGHFNTVVYGTGSYTLKISAVGYTDNYKAVRIAEGDSVASVGNILMIEGVQLGEVEVKDRRAEKGRRVYSNILTRSDIESSGAKDILSALKGHIAGMVIRKKNAGVPGGAIVHVTIRGPSSINLSTEPLIIVDGIRMYPFPDETPLGTVNNNIPIDLVESIEVNKTGEGYGAEGANGVIIIKTRRGK